MRRFGAILTLLVLVLGLGARQSVFATPVGTQCPTARAQTIRVPVLSACGCVIGSVERAPKPGERGFLQCRCAEKRAAHEAAGVPADALGAAMPALLTPAPVLRFALPVRALPLFDTPTLFVGRSLVPPVRPPVGR